MTLSSDLLANPNNLITFVTDNKNFTYGFDINSLITTYKKKGVLINPYNRERLTKKEHFTVIRLYHLIMCLYNDYNFGDDYSQPPINSQSNISINQYITQPVDLSNNPIINNPIINNLNSSIPQYYTHNQSNSNVTAPNNNLIETVEPVPKSKGFRTPNRSRQ